MAPGWSRGAQKSSADAQRAGESIGRVRWPKLEGRIFRPKETGAQGGSRRTQMAPGWSRGAQKSSADSQRAGESIGRVRWPKLEGRIFRPKETGAQGGPRRAQMAPGWSHGAQKSSADAQRAGESNARVRWPKLEGRIFRPKETGAQREPRRTQMAPSWSHGAQKNSADSQRAGESNARVRWPKLEGRIFRPKETGAHGGSRRAQMAPGWSHGAQKSSEDSQRAGESIGRERWPKLEGRIFRPKETGAQGGPRRAQMAPGWSHGAQKSSADSQRAGESIGRVR